MIRRCLAVLLIRGFATPADAQDDRPTGYPRSANERSDKPVTRSAVYVADIRSNVSGGIARGTRYLDHLDLQVAIDAERLVKSHGARVFLHGIYDDGASLSGDLVGDPPSSSLTATPMPKRIM